MMGSVGIRDRNTRKGTVSPVQNETICGRPHPNVPSTPPPCSLKLPDGPKMRIAAYQQLAVCLAPLRQNKQVIEACEQGLRVDPFNATLHRSLAIAEAETGDLTNAVIHLRLALALK